MSQYARYPALGGGGGTVTNVTASTPLSSTGGATPDISIQNATALQDGALTSTDWNTFNNKQPAGSYAVTANNLSDLASAATARTNLGLGTAAVEDVADFNPTTTTGDLIFRNGAVLDRLAIGSEAQVLEVVGGLPVWAAQFLELFGAKTDGNLTLSGPLTLTNDVFYDTLTLTAGAAITTAGWRIFCRVLDLSNAPAAAIRRNGANGNGAVGSAGAGLIGALTANTLGGGGSGGAGATGVIGAGAQAGAVGSQVNANGGNSGASGAGGAGLGGAGGAARAASTATQGVAFNRMAIDFLRGPNLIGGGAGGSGGGSGGGDGVNLGRGGGGGAAAGAVIAIYAHTVITSEATPAGVISCVGGNGGPGASATVGNVGGGGGGTAGGGGYVYIMYAKKTGAPVAGLITAAGGNGGNGGNGFGTGTGGNGAGGGTGGQVTLFNVTTGVGTSTVGVAGTAGTAGSGVTGGSGGAGGACSVAL